jgi:very-long-chain (3R)-3-hydroxyacyl-CoA dehydratase
MKMMANRTCYVGVVRAPVSTTAMQVASRLLLVWLIVNPFPWLAKSAGYSSMLIAWSVTEVIRYGFFTLSLSDLLPSFLMWLRYNTFYILYPLGISSECWLIYKAIEPAKELRLEYAWALQLILFIYVPGKAPVALYSSRTLLT